MYKSGDRVRVKTWDELLATPGARLLDNGEIYHEDSYFVPSMKKYCGNEITPNNQDHGHFTVRDREGFWYFSDWMLTPVEEAMEIKAVSVHNTSTGELLKTFSNPLEHVARLEDLKVGMPVFDFSHGWSKVTSLEEDRPYQIRVKHESGGHSTYAVDGKRHVAHAYPSLFLIDIFNGTNPPEPEVDWSKVPMDTEVEVRDSCDIDWNRRKFFGYFPKNTHGHFFACNEGSDCAATDSAFAWEMCRLAVPAEKEWLK